MTKHAQHKVSLHVKAIRAQEPFETYGNLSGQPWTENPGIMPSRGWMNRAALKALEYDSYGFGFAAGGRVTYILFSYSTPIAWHVSGGPYPGWRIDDTRHSAPSDAALSVVRSVVGRLRGGDPDRAVYWVNYRHRFSPKQVELLEEAAYNPLLGVKIAGPQIRTARVLAAAKAGCIETSSDGHKFFISRIGEAMLSGSPIMSSDIANMVPVMS